MNPVLYEETFRAETAHWWFLALHELVDRVIGDYRRRRKDPAAGLKIFDAGCGTGQLMTRLQKYGSVEGIDFSEEAVDYCRQRELGNVQCKDLNDWFCDRPTFDVITNLDVLYHERIAGDTLILKKFYTALKDEGLLILNVAAFDCLRRAHDTLGHGARRYRRHSMVRKLKEIGFKIRIQSYRLSYLFLPLLAKVWVERRQGLSSGKSDLASLPAPFWNRILLQINRLENKLIQRFNLPFGVSLFITAQKPKRLSPSFRPE